jgi:hypothetical protein
MAGRGRGLAAAVLLLALLWGAQAANETAAAAAKPKGAAKKAAPKAKPASQAKRPPIIPSAGEASAVNGMGDVLVEGEPGHGRREGANCLPEGPQRPAGASRPL